MGRFPYHSPILAEGRFSRLFPNKLVFFPLSACHTTASVGFARSLVRVRFSQLAATAFGYINEFHTIQ